MKNFDWPVICKPTLAQRISVFSAPDELSNATVLGVKSGWFRNLTIIDSSGAVRRVRNASIGSLSNRTLLLLKSLFGGLVTVSLDFADIGETIELARLKELVGKELDEYLYDYEARGDLGEIKHAIAAAKTHREVIVAMRS